MSDQGDTTYEDGPDPGDALLGAVLSLDAERPDAPQDFRWRTGFHWARVDRGLLERLLLAASVDGVVPDQLPELDDRAMATIAEGAFGPTLRPRAMDRIGPVLRDDWLSAADDETLKELCLVTQSALGRAFTGLLLRSRPQRIAFLTERKLSKNFKTNLRRAFMRAHRGAWLVDEASSRTFRVEEAYRVLQGAGLEPAYAPYAHAVAAWEELERLEASGGAVRGLIVLPTGAGKTDVAVEWLLRRLEADPELRVLWVVHQIALLEQAAARISAKALERDPGFERVLRIFCSGGEPLTTMHPSQTHIVLATIQTLSRELGKRGRRTRQVRALFEHPVLVVVDEAHHATANGYQLLLEIGGEGNLQDLIGLTATPWPRTEAAQQRLQRTFPARIIERSREELVAQRVLATYDYTAVPTPGIVELTDQERADIRTRGDFTSGVLRKLETEERNRLVVSTYLQQRERWGRTLLFTTTIENAERLTAMLEKEQVQASPLHSASGTRLAELRPWFKQNPDAVLVSVGMLLEGVDLPEARTALIARPTTSSVVLNQMIGRVLRGTAAGGEGEAHVIYLVDDFADFGGLATPRAPEVEDDASGDGATWVKPRTPMFPFDLAGEVFEMLQWQLRAERMATEPSDEEVEGDGGDELEPEDPLPFVALESRRLVGYYAALDELKVPVLDNQHDELEAYMAAIARDERIPSGLFRSLPRPSSVHLEALAEAVRLDGTPLELHPVQRDLSPRALAATLEDDTPRTAAEVHRLIAEAYEDALYTVVYPSVRHFEEAVERARFELRTGRDGGPERAHEPLEDTPLDRLPRGPRDLDGIVDRAMNHANRHLPASRKAKLVRPTVSWTRAVERGKFGEWRLGDEPGEHIITINRLLKTSGELVSDDVVGFVVWHELIHALTPGQHHDAEFYALEGLWPDALTCEAALDAIPHRWSMRPHEYPSPRARVAAEVLAEWHAAGRIAEPVPPADAVLRADLDDEVERRIDAVY